MEASCNIKVCCENTGHSLVRCGYSFSFSATMSFVAEIYSSILAIIDAICLSSSSPVCFDMIDAAYMTKCGHSFW